MLWITHQHSDHLGSAPQVLERFKVRIYADNGTDPDKAQVKHAHVAAAQNGTTVLTVDGPQELPLPMNEAVRYTPILPAVVGGCGNANNCSIGLRIDYCASSVLFVGDAEAEEEREFAVGPVTLLQAGHHGSDTSSTDDFIEKVQPKYVVISSAKPDEGTNKTYCHPRASTVQRLSAATGSPATDMLIAFDGAVSCRGAGAEHWLTVPVSPQVFSTARDGDVTLVTSGDGVFQLADKYGGDR
jgi:competence protein ComEC